MKPRTHRWTWRPLLRYLLGLCLSWASVLALAQSPQLEELYTQAIAAGRGNNSSGSVPLLTQVIDQANQLGTFDAAKHATLYLVRGSALERQNQIAKAMEDYQTAISKWSSNTDSVVSELLIICSANLGNLQVQAGQYPQAGANYEFALKTWGMRTDRGVLIQMARIYWQYGFLHEKNLQVDSAFQIYERAIALYASYSHPLMDIRLANIHNNKGSLLGQLKRLPEAFATFDGVIEKYGSKTDPLVIEQVIRARFNKAFYRFWILGEREAALQDYQSILNQWGARTEAPISQQLIYVLLQTAQAYELKSNLDEAIKTHEALIKRAEAFQTQQSMLSALTSKAWIASILLQQEKYPASLAICSEILNAHSSNTNILFQAEIVKTLLTKARNQHAQRLPQEAIKTYDFLIEKFSNINNANISRAIDQAKDERLVATRNSFILQRPMMPRRF